MPTALVRRPGPLLAEGLLTHLTRQAIDPERGLEQWQSYVEVLRATGWSIDEVDPADEHPDAVFVEDTVVIFDDVAVMTRPGADVRRGEIAATEAAVRRHVEKVLHIAAPATLDGGDILKVGATVYVGLSGRTNAAAVDQLRRLLPARSVIPVPVTKVLHLKSQVTALPDGTVIGHPPLVDRPALFERFLPVPEESGSAVVDLGADRLLMAADCPRSASLLEQRGYEVITTDISEFQKLEGCVTCLSVRIR